MFPAVYWPYQLPLALHAGTIKGGGWADPPFNIRPHSKTEVNLVWWIIVKWSEYWGWEVWITIMNCWQLWVMLSNNWLKKNMEGQSAWEWKSLGWDKKKGHGSPLSPDNSGRCHWLPVTITSSLFKSPPSPSHRIKVKKLRPVLFCLIVCYFCK